jgi:hypothetical protein
MLINEVQRQYRENEELKSSLNEFKALVRSRLGK